MSLRFQPPDLAEFPRRSYRRFLETTLGDLFAEISPLASEFNTRFELSFVGPNGKVRWWFEDYSGNSGYPNSSETARKTNMTHARRLKVELWLRDTITNELRKSVVYMGDVPVITDRGTFVVNGSERVVLSQLVRAPGVYFQMVNPRLYKGLILAEVGAPILLELSLGTSADKHGRAKCRIKLPGRGWIAATSLLAAVGLDAADLQRQLGQLLENNNIDWKRLTRAEALGSLGRAWKPDGGSRAGSAALRSFADKRHYSLGSLGRRRFNNRLGLDRFQSNQQLTLSADDLLAAVEYLLKLPAGDGTLDNLDSLENRHLKGVGEVLSRAVRPALAKMASSSRARLELLECDQLPDACSSLFTRERTQLGSPNQCIDPRPFTAAITKFFTSNPLVQYLDQQNPLSELSHRRRVTSFGPGGVDPNATPLEMRDVHPSQIGRVCLIESPEGTSCGMVSNLATYCRVDEDGFMTVPYRRVNNGLLTNEIVYLAPAEDKHHTLAPPDAKTDGDRLVGTVQARRGDCFCAVGAANVDLIGIAPQGFVSIGSGLIPFLEHDDANRALMGGSMMRQTLPLIRPERARVGTGMERIVGQASGHSVTAKRGGTVSAVSGTEIQVTQSSGESRCYPLIRYDRTNQGTVLDQRPSVRLGQTIEAGQIIADGAGIDQGELALGRNLLVAFLSWDGYNYEDAMVVRQGLIRDHRLSHVEIEKHVVDVFQTLRGPQILTPELSNVAKKQCEHLDARGIARIGSFVDPGDILVGKLSPKEAGAMSVEDELLTAVFGKLAEDMADCSLRVPQGSSGRVIDVRIFTPETTPELKPGIICQIEVLLARLCATEIGDKLAGRHGNKGVVASIVRDEDMPYLPDGTPVDLIINPLGVPSRLNVGQVFDSQLGLYASILNRHYRIHQFDESLGTEASANLVSEALAEVRQTPGYEWLGADGKVVLYDGRTGEPFDNPVLVGRQYMLKLNQLVVHKINARAGLGGPYAAVTQQPVGGKSNQGGQRLGEMEVWAIQAYGASKLLHEIMTVKSDDMQGRIQAYADMVQGKRVTQGGRTAAFDGLCCELRGLGLEVKLGRVLSKAEAAEHQAEIAGNISLLPVRKTQRLTSSNELQHSTSKIEIFESNGQTIVEIPAGEFEQCLNPPGHSAKPIDNNIIKLAQVQAKAEAKGQGEEHDDDDDDDEIDEVLAKAFVNAVLDLVSNGKTAPLSSAGNPATEVSSNQASTESRGFSRSGLVDIARRRRLLACNSFEEGSAQLTQNLISEAISGANSGAITKTSAVNTQMGVATTQAPLAIGGQIVAHSSQAASGQSQAHEIMVQTHTPDTQQATTGDEIEQKCFLDFPSLGQLPSVSHHQLAYLRRRRRDKLLDDESELKLSVKTVD